MQFDESKTTQERMSAQTEAPVSHGHVAPQSTGGGYEEQAAALSPRQPLIDPASGLQVGTYLDYDGVIKVFDRGGQLVWIDELPIQSTVGPLDVLFGIRSLIAAGAAVAKSIAYEANHRQKANTGASIAERIPDFVWSQLRAAAS